jgi:murein L,D-transpeptidase YafK
MRLFRSPLSLFLWALALWGIALSVSKNIQAQEYMPVPIVQMDAVFGHHVLVVEKSTHTLIIYENNQGLPREVKRYKVASGKFRGDKFKEGDHKTPEGIYTLKEFFPDSDLLNKHGEMAKMYGIGAFTTNYPNFMDQRAGKSGSGIWLHSTDDDSRIDKALDSRGCVVVNDINLKDISKYLDLPHTPIVIVEELKFRPREAWEKSAKEINDTVQAWISAWQEKDFLNYINFYHPHDFHDKTRGGYQSFKAYKQAVFSRPDKPTIKFDYISILNFDDYAVATMKQDYQSEVINDVGKKTLYLKKDQNYNWRIVGELWEKYTDKNNIAFSPSQRFFQE